MLSFTHRAVIVGANGLLAEAGYMLSRHGKGWSSPHIPTIPECVHINKEVSKGSETDMQEDSTLN
jgi:hypothetical protein